MQCLFMRGVHSKAAVISKSHFLNHSEGFCRERSMEELQSMAFLNLKPLLYENKILFPRMVQIDY